MEQFKFHIGLNVKDIEETTTFYKKLFGTDPVKVEEGYSKFELDNPGLVISFIESENTGPHFGHLGIRVNSQEELVQKKEEIESLIKIELEEKNTSCCYAVQNKFWVKDPNGYEWEVYHFLKDADSMGGNKRVASTNNELVGCC